MNREDIIELSKTNTYDEFMEEYCKYQLCPSIYGFKDTETQEECDAIDCAYCWEKALRDIKFKEEESDEDKQNDLLDDIWEQELETQQDLINGTR